MSGDRVLFLGPADSPLRAWLETCGEAVLQTDEAIGGGFLDEHGIGFLVSYGYRHILRRDVLDRLPDRAVNLHIAYLPWNRGADPNFWSFVDDTPKGVTIHYLDEGVDTGDIIVQQEVRLDAGRETFATSYRRLHGVIQALFREHWPEIRRGTCSRTPQYGAGSTHRAKDREPLAHLLTAGWDTPVADVARALRAR